MENTNEKNVEFETERGDEMMEQTTEKGITKDITTLPVISKKYNIPYDTLYKEVVQRDFIPYVRCGGIRVSESTFRKIFIEKGFAI